jgi:peptidoglycan/xylan/chitin deacetylase (PgdA/CDA1 family)
MKLLLAALLYYSGVERVLRWLIPRRGVAIFMLHSVRIQNSLTRAAGFSMDVKSFERRMRFLRRYHCITISNVAEVLSGKLSLPNDAVVITFDDGYADNCLYAFPILNRFSLPATVYLTTSYIGSDQWLPMNQLYDAIWRTTSKTLVVPDELMKVGTLPATLPLGTEAQKLTAISCLRSGLKRMATDRFEACIETMAADLLSEVSSMRGGDFDMLDWNQVQTMSGLVEFGSHTASHTILSRAGKSRQEIEIARSKSAIQENLGSQPAHFAYPNGHREDYNEHSIQLLRQQGYQTAVTTEVGLNDSSSDPYQLRRMGLESPNCLIALELLGITERLRARGAKSRNRSLMGVAV